MRGTNGEVEGFGARIREERERLKLSVSEFSSGVGVSDRTQRNYESGERLPDAAYLYAAGNLGADTDYVITGERSVWRTFAEGVNEEQAILGKVLSEIDAAISRTGASLDAVKKNNCILHLYRVARFGGPLTAEVAEELVKLATG